jgi:hypothetical protein
MSVFRDFNFIDLLASPDNLLTIHAKAKCHAIFSGRARVVA